MAQERTKLESGRSKEICRSASPILATGQQREMKKKMMMMMMMGESSVDGVLPGLARFAPKMEAAALLDGLDLCPGKCSPHPSLLIKKNLSTSFVDFFLCILLLPIPYLC